MIDRLGPLEATLLEGERSATPLHVGGVSLFSGELRFSDVQQAVAERLDELPLARRRVRRPGPAGGGPLWADDVEFDLSYHVRHAALPAPGDAVQLGEFVARLIGRGLDLQRPLWEMYVIGGLQGGRSAIFRKVHLAMAGESGGDPFPLILSEQPRALSAARQRSGRWEPAPPPSSVALAADAARTRADLLARAARQGAGVMVHPGRAAAAVAGAAGGVASLALRSLRAAPRSPLNGRLSAHRRFATAVVSLAALRSVRAAVGGTINDAVVAITGDAVGRLLRWRGHDTKDLDLRVLLPVRMQGAGDGEPVITGEGVVGVLAPLPVLEMDPLARLYRVRGELAHLSGQAVAAGTLARVAGYGPARLHALAARLVTAEQRYNVALSNAPGPQEPRYLLGSAMEASYPFIPLAGDCGLSVAVSSYAGSLHVGLLGDRDLMPDLDVLGELITEAAADLVEAAGAGQASSAP